MSEEVDFSQYHVHFSWSLFTCTIFENESLIGSSNHIPCEKFKLRIINNEVFKKKLLTVGLRLLAMLQILFIMLFGNPIKFTLLCLVFLPLCSDYAPFIPSHFYTECLPCQIYCNLSFTCQVHYFQGLKPIQNCRCRSWLLFSFTYIFLLME